MGAAHRFVRDQSGQQDRVTQGQATHTTQVRMQRLLLESKDKNVAFFFRRSIKDIIAAEEKPWWESEQATPLDKDASQLNGDMESEEQKEPVEEVEMMEEEEYEEEEEEYEEEEEEYEEDEPVAKEEVAETKVDVPDGRQHEEEEGDWEWEYYNRSGH